METFNFAHRELKPHQTSQFYLFLLKSLETSKPQTLFAALIISPPWMFNRNSAKTPRSLFPTKRVYVLHFSFSRIIFPLIVTCLRSLPAAIRCVSFMVAFSPLRRFFLVFLSTVEHIPQSGSEGMGTGNGRGLRDGL